MKQVMYQNLQFSITNLGIYYLECHFKAHVHNNVRPAGRRPIDVARQACPNKAGSRYA